MPTGSAMPSGSFMGNAVLRREDPDLLTGTARFVGDMSPEGTVHLAFVRSVMAHANINSVDTEAARAAPGVLDVLTASNLPLAAQPLFILLPPELSRLPLADKARYVGDPIAVVVAESRVAAIDAAELVQVDYEPLVAVPDPFNALEPGAPVVIEAHGSNLAMQFSTPTDPDAMVGHNLAVKCRIINHRVSGAPIEPSAALAAPGIRDSAEGVTLWCTSQRPHEVRNEVAAALGTPPEGVRVIAPAVGGGFGSKSPTYPEFIIAAWLARHLGRPVKWIETRSENLVNMTQGRDHVHDVELGLSTDGTFRWIKIKVTANVGAYPGIGAFLPFFTMLMASGPYRIPAVHYEAVAAVTNTTPVAAFRGAGRPEATVCLERIIDLAAAELGVDPAELRRRNLLAPGDFPLTTPTGANMDCGDYARSLDLALETARYSRIEGRAGPPAGRGRPEAARHRRVDLRGGDRGRAVPGVRVGHCRARRHGHRAGGHRLARPGDTPPPSPRYWARCWACPPSRCGSSTATPPRCPGAPARWRRGRCRSAAARCGPRPTRSSTRRGAWPPACSKPTSATSWWLRAGWPPRACRRGRCRGPSWPRPRPPTTCPPASSRGVWPRRPTSTRARPATRSAPMCRWWRSTPAPVRRRVLRHIAVDDCGRILNPVLVEGQVHGGVATGISQAL